MKTIFSAFIGFNSFYFCHSSVDLFLLLTVGLVIKINLVISYLLFKYSPNFYPHVTAFSSFLFQFPTYLYQHRRFVPLLPLVPTSILLQISPSIFEVTHDSHFHHEIMVSLLYLDDFEYSLKIQVIFYSLMQFVTPSNCLQIISGVN